MRFCLISVFFLNIFRLFAASIDVCSNCAYNQIDAAIQNSQPHDSILVYPGVYKVIDQDIAHPMSIIALGEVILDGNKEAYILRVFADSVTISGFVFRNSGHSYTHDYAAIYISRSSQFWVENNTIIDPFFGILIEKSNNGLVKNNTVYGEAIREDDGGNGIHLWHCSDVIVDRNEIYKMRDGIYLEFVDDSQISNNYGHDNVRYGLHFMFSNRDAYLDNTFENNGAGVAVMFSKFIRMEGNHFVRNWGTASYGLLLKEIYDAEVISNTFEENTIGIFIEGSTRINYTSNDFVQNGWALRVSGGCYTNVFSTNNFIANSFDLSYNAKMNDNVFNGNYWSSYSGYDIDKDGVGDVPYRPVKLFSYIVNRTPETIILLRSLFVDMINFSEKVSPVFTPDDLIDDSPSMKVF